MKLTIVGASGYVGRRLLARAAGRHDVLGTSTRGGDGLVALDLAADDAPDPRLLAPDRTLIFAAAISAPDACARDVGHAHRVNVERSGALIAAALDAGARVLFLSSDTVYGERPAPFDERAPCAPVGVYAQMKHAIERRFAAAPGFRTARLSYVFSEQDRFSAYLAECARAGRPAQAFDALARRCVSREDVVDCLLALAARWDEVPQRIVNVGGPELLTRAAMAEAWGRAHAGLEVRREAPPPGFFDNRPRVIDMDSPLLAGLLGRPPARYGAAHGG